MKTAPLFILPLLLLADHAVAHQWGTLTEAATTCHEFYQEQVQTRAANRPLDTKGLLFMHPICQNPAFADLLNAEDRNAMASFDGVVAAERAGMDADTAAELAAMAQDIVNGLRSGECTIADADSVDRQVRAVWGEMRSALLRGDTEAALDCFHPQSRERYRNTFSQLGGAQLRQLAAEMGEPELAKNSSGTLRYLVVRKQHNRSLVFDLTVDFDENCALKIVAY